MHPDLWTAEEANARASTIVAPIIGAKQHGGRRAGAGRKPAGSEPRRPVTVWLTEAERARLREIGNGNASEGVRRLLADHFAPDWPEPAAAP